MFIFKFLLSFQIIFGFGNLVTRCKVQADCVDVTSYMDESVKQCDNFYDYACGGFIKNTNLPEDQPQIDTQVDSEYFFTILNSSFSQKISPTDIKPYKLVKHFYQSCLNAPDETRDLGTLLQILADLGNWPIISTNWDESSFSWQNVTSKAYKIGYSADYLITFNVEIDKKNTSRHMITLKPASLAVPREYLIEGRENQVVKAYYDYMKGMIELLGKNFDENVNNELENIIQFETDLAKSQITSKPAPIYNPKTIVELSTKYPNISWTSYLNNILSTSNIQVDQDVTVNVINEDFFGNLEKLLSGKSNRIQSNYILWRIIHDSVLYLTEGAREKELIFSGENTGQKARNPRWIECIDTTVNHLDVAAGAIYVRDHFDNETKGEVSKIVKNIQKQYEKAFTENSWMDDAAKRFAVEKLREMNIYVAYPDELFIDSKLYDFYSTLTLSSSGYFQNILNIRKFDNQFTIQMLNKPAVKNDWLAFPNAVVVNAYYAEETNSLYLPAAILRGVFFDKNRPQSMNYGAIGFSIAHEISHGYSVENHLFDKNGLYTNGWEKRTEDSLSEKTQCIKDQYNNYQDEITKLYLNGTDGIRENFADVVGIQMAYRAYNEVRSSTSPESKSKFNNDELFYIGFATSWCVKYQPKILEAILKTTAYSPASARINSALANLDSFASLYKCKPGKMNQSKKCTVW